jgi:hypothetical protein
MKAFKGGLICRWLVKQEKSIDRRRREIIQNCDKLPQCRLDQSRAVDDCLISVCTDCDATEAARLSETSERLLGRDM